MPGHGHTSDELFAMLKRLSFVEELPSGRDLRGATLSGGVHELDFRACDFSYARIQMNFVNCDFTGARFDEATVKGIILKTLDGASFRKAKLQGCFFQKASARQCCFDQATLMASSFEAADLSGTSFREADCKRAKFLGANLTGCDFRNANLQGAVLQEVQLDASTDLRGASLVNAFLNELKDRAGNPVARATNWQDAKWDASTQVGSDQREIALEILERASAILNNQTEPKAAQLRQRIEKLKSNLRSKYRPDWYETLLSSLETADASFAESVMNQATRGLL